MIGSIDEKLTLADGSKIPGFGAGVFDVDDAFQAVTNALDTGYRLIDTAAFYGNEKETGAAISKSLIPRQDIFVITKMWPKDYVASPRAARDSFERLGLEYIDLFLLHWPGVDVKLRNYAWESILNMREKGFVRSVGVSNFLEPQIEGLIREFGILPVANEIEVHPWFQRNDLRDYCLSKNIAVIAWGPLLHGHLHEEPLLAAIGNRYGKSAAQIALRWSIENNTIPIPKSSSRVRLLSNRKLFDFQLSESDRALILSLDGKGSVVQDDPLTFSG